MPVVTIEMWEGRTVEQKRNLVKTVASAVAKAIGCADRDVVIIIRDAPKVNWGIGGELASDKFP
jgi:4-oxalocrotonate tautomerase